MAEELNMDDVRAHAQAIVERAKSDLEFRERLQSDPEGTLKEAGFDDGAIGDLTAEFAEVEGHARCTYTCLISICGYFTL